MSVMGHVSLVGAGPGDPELLTRKALHRLRRADLVLYDALVDERVIALARRAQRFFVGKRAGRHALSQQEIHAVMIRAARRGRRVVRLKGGDPFVFGRGGEEAQALQQAVWAGDVTARRARSGSDGSSPMCLKRRNDEGSVGWTQTGIRGRRVGRLIGRCDLWAGV